MLFFIHFVLKYTNMLNILVISDDEKKIAPLFNNKVVAFYTREQRQKDKAATGDPVRVNSYDIALLDLDSKDWHERLLELRHKVPVIAFSSPDIKRSVEAMKSGASDYMVKPLAGEALEQVLNKYEKELLNHKAGFDEIIGISQPMQEVFNLIKKAAVSESNVLITGESGTGKEPVARAIHKWGPRSEKSFMTINCSAIPDTLLESELFGFEKGSFTGANYTKKGILELADGGTVFLDEIGDVSPLFQTKALRVIQEGEIMRIGGMKNIKVDVRFIAATNKDLKLACRKGTFREDLFYRLNVINIHLPTLRDRMEDIPFLVQHFIKKHRPKKKDIFIKGISDEAMSILTDYSYPGNVRELENIIERAISFAGHNEILPPDLPAFMLHSTPKRRTFVPKMKEAIAGFEKELIWSALQESQGNISKAAAILGIYRQQLQRKIRKLKIAT